MEKSLLLKGNRVVFPMVQLEKYLHDLQENHAGIAKSQAEAHNITNWPGKNGHTCDFIFHCRVYIQPEPSQTTEP